MGGEHSMGPGGFARTPIEQVSPISFDLKQNRKRASLAEIIAVDYSGSMSATAGGRTKLELANEAAVRSSDLLGAGDRLGVMHVDTEVRWTVPLAPVEDKESIASRIRAVSTGGGGIYVDLALATSYAAIAREHVNLKHVLLFADGDDAEQMNDSVRLVGNAKRQGITTSVIALGRGADVAALERLSKLGDGRFYLIEDATRLPAVFAQETILAARSAINEVTFVPTPANAGAAIRGIDFAQAPPLTGYVVGVPKSRAQVHLTGPDGDPLLATWSAGIGRVAAFTSDYEDRWGKAWTGWSGAARLFAQIGRDIARLADDPRVRVQADATGGELHLSANVVDDDGRTESFRRFKVRLAGPGGFARELPLEVSGAGVYSASVPLSRLGPYVATVIDEAKGEPVGTTGAVLSAGEELRPTGSDRAVLARIALMTGGKVRDTLAGLFNDRSGRRFAYDDVSGLCAMLSALFLLGSVATRRLLFSWRGATLFARLTNALTGLVRRRRTDTPTTASAAPTLGALLRRKARAPEPAHAPAVPVRTHVPRAHPTPHAAAVPAPPTAPDEAAPASRPRTAAEILLERRRQRRQ
jgi:Mg-chelatase subunit ChlD